MSNPVVTETSTSGKSSRKRGDRVGKHPPYPGRSRPDPHPARRADAQRLDLGDGVADLHADAAGVRHQPLADRRRRYAVGAAVEELDAELGLEECSAFERVGWATFSRSAARVMFSVSTAAWK